MTSACLIYPYDVKRSLGINGTVHDGYFEPKRLVPKGLVLHVCTNTVLAIGALTRVALHRRDAPKIGIDVPSRLQCSKDALNHLSQQEKSDIANSFQNFDINGDGAISRAEAIGYAQQRTMKGRAVNPSFSNILPVRNRYPMMYKSKSCKRSAGPTLEEAELQLMTMLENADIDGNGSLTYDEFALAEAWWLRSTLNPEKVLF